MLWCVSDPDYIVRITEPFRSGQRIRLHIASETATSPVMAVKRSIRHLACTSDLVATVVHVENVSRSSISNYQESNLFSSQGGYTR
jgi:hypothetical protein